MSDYELEGLIKLRDETGEATHSASQNMKQLDKQTQSTAGAMGGFADIVNVASAAMTTFGVIKVGKAIAELTALGMQVERTENTFKGLSGGIAEADANLSAMQRGTLSAIRDSELMERANRLLHLGLAETSGELEEVSRMATTLGRAMGLDARESLDGFTFALSSQSAPALRRFGIDAETVTSSVDRLLARYPHLTKEQAFLTAALEAGRETMGDLGDTMEDNLLKAEQSAAAWGSFNDEIGKAYSSTLAFALDVSAPFGRFFADQIRGLNDLTARYGWLEARIRSIISILSGGAVSPWNTTDLLARQQSFMSSGYTSPSVPAREPNWAQTQYREGGVMLTGPSNNITMYNPQFNGVQDAQSMLQQLEALSP